MHTTERQSARETEISSCWHQNDFLWKNLYKRLYNKHQEEFRQSWFESSGAESVHQQLLANTANLDEDELQLQSDEKFTDADMLGKPDPYLQPYFPHRFRIAQFFYGPSNLSLSISDIVEDLARLAHPNRQILFYPGESPVNGQCPRCSTEMER